MKNIPETRRVQ